MFHTLHLAERSMTAQESSPLSSKYLVHPRQSNNHKLYFPPLLAVETSSSMDSQDGGAAGNTKRDKTVSSSGRTTPESPISSSNASSPVSRMNYKVISTSTTASPHLQPQVSSTLPAGTAKELPIWMIGIFLLLHCEDQVFYRCVNHTLLPTLMTSTALSTSSSDVWSMNSALSPRTRMHAGHFTDSTRCARFLLRHLRKFLLVCAIPHNAEAFTALMKLSISSSIRDSDFLTPRSNPSRSVDANYNYMSTTQKGGDMGRQSQLPTKTSQETQHRTQVNSIHSSLPSSKNPLSLTEGQHPHDVQAIQNQHQEEHADIGIHIRLSKDDIERLSLIIEAPFGGYMDDIPLQITDIIPSSVISDLTSNGGIRIEDLEKEITRYLISDLVHIDHSPKDLDLSQIINDIQMLSLNEKIESSEPSTSYNEETQTSDIADDRIIRQPKSLRIYNCHHTTIIRKPQKERSIFQPSLSLDGEINPLPINMSVPRLLNSIHNQSGRLHDICINACSDSHIYLLQPFEHVSISGCINCTIVIGAVAGLLHVVDCERTKITVAARRIIVSNCLDVLHFAFTPSKPLLVGDNRSCQFAPYNTYYDGLQEDLLITALAAVKVQSQENDMTINSISMPQMVLSKNMWKNPEDLTKLGISQVVSQHTNVLSASSSGSSNPGSDTVRNTSSDDMMQTPILLPPSEFHILYVPVPSSIMCEASMLKNIDGMNSVEDGTHSNLDKGGSDSPYCRFLADVISISPLRPPSEYERQVLTKVEKVRSLQQAIGSLTVEQQITLEDDLNRMFRDWLVSSGNLRQVLDLVHMIK